MIKIQLQLSGLDCQACEKVITKRLKTIKGVDKVEVSSQDNTALITASRSILKDEVIQVLADTHYKLIKILS